MDDGWWRRWVLTILGSVVTLVGIVVFVSAPESMISFGWTAYTPLSEISPSPPQVFLGGQRLWGLVVGVVGLVELSAAIGFRVGARSR